MAIKTDMSLIDKYDYLIAGPFYSRNVRIQKDSSAGGGVELGPIQSLKTIFTDEDTECMLGSFVIFQGGEGSRTPSHSTWAASQKTGVGVGVVGVSVKARFKPISSATETI